MQTEAVMTDRYEELKAEVLRLQAEGRVSTKLTAAERADWAFGNAVIENVDVTREMAEQAVRDRDQ